MHIHEAAELAGVTPRTIRFYEVKGLMSPAKRAANGYREYDRQDVARLIRIAAYRELGVPVEMIGELLAGSPSFELLNGLRASLYEEMHDLQRRVGAVERLLDESSRSGDSGGEDMLLALAGELRELRSVRRQWLDRWRFDELADTFDAAPLPQLQGIVPRSLYERALDETVDWLDPLPGERGLDLGAGTGNLTVRLASRGASVTAVEQSASMLDVLRSKLPGLPAKMGNLLSLPVLDERYAFVCSSFTLQHLDVRQQDMALSEMDRVLADRGRICLTGLFDADELASYGVPEVVFYPASSRRIADWFRLRGYETAVHRLRDPVGIVYAVRGPG